MRKKYIIAILCLILCLIFVFALYYTSNREEVTIAPIEAFNQKDTVSFISSWGAYDSKAGRLKKTLKSICEAHPNLEIEDASMAGEDFLFILKTDFACGNDPNIFGLWPGSDFDLLVAQGKVADLTDVLMKDQQWYSQFKDEIWDYVTVEDRIYGLPTEIIYEGLFINKDLFEKYKVKVPTNFGELLDAVAEFKAHNIIPIAYSETPEGSYIYQNIVMKLGGKADVENPFDENGKIKPCFIQGMEYMKHLYEAGAFSEKLYAVDDKKRNDLFINKKAAMIVQGSWFIGDNALNSQDTTVDIIPFPDMPDGKADSSAIIYGCGNGIFHMSQKAWEDEALRENCLTILKELTSPKTMSVFVGESGFISSIELEEYAPEETVMSIKGDYLIENAEELIGPVDSFINRGIWEDIIIKQLPLVLKGIKTPEEVFEMVYNTRNE